MKKDIMWAMQINRNLCPTAWLDMADNLIERFINELPHGSGFNDSPEIIDANDGCIQIKAPYHCLDEHGYYCGWAYFYLEITPTFGEYPDIKVTNIEADNDEAKEIADNCRYYVVDAYTEAIPEALRKAQ